MKRLLALLTALLIASPALAAPPAIPPSAPFQAVNSIPNVYNFTPTSLPRYRAAFAKALSGGASVRVAFLGDSTTMGAGSGSGGALNVTGAKVTSYPAQLAKLFKNHGYVVAQDSQWGDNFNPGNTPAGLTAYNPNITFAGSSWSINTSFGYTAGGGAMQNVSGTDILALTPVTNTDTVTVCYAINIGGGTFTVKDGVTLLGTINTAGTNNTTACNTYSRTASTNAINIARNGTGNQINILSIDTYLAATQVRIFNWGAYGWRTSEWVNNGTGFAPYYEPANINPDIVVISLGINDYRGGIASATTQVNLQTIITNLKANSTDIVLMMPMPDNAPVNSARYAALVGIYRSLALSNNLPMVDLRARYGSYAVANANGEYYDSIHQTSVGYADIASALWQVLRPQ